MKYDSLVFDLDGTLWDSGESVYRAWLEVLLGEYHATRVPSREDISSIMGLPSQAIADKLFSEYGERRLQVLERCMDRECDYLRRHGGRLYPRVPETLARLAERYPLAIVSNCQAGYIESFLTYHGLEACFRDIQWEQGRSKGENIKRLVQRNGFRRPLYVGDTVLDQQAAGQAGVDFLWAAYGFGSGLDTDRRLASFCQLPQVLEIL